LFVRKKASGDLTYEPKCFDIKKKYEEVEELYNEKLSPARIVKVIRKADQ
jgi:hypothetical protein